MITLAEFKIFNLLSMSSNTGIRCRGNRDLVSSWNKSRRAMNRADSRYLNLLFDIVDGEAKPWCDSVYRSLVFHDKTLFEKERERSESGAGVIETSFHLWNKSRRAMNRADSDSLKSSLRIIP